MDESTKAVYQSLIKSFRYLNQAIDQSVGSDNLPEKRLQTLLSSFEEILEDMLKEMNDEDIAKLSTPGMTAPWKRSFGEVIRYRREKKGLSREQLADAVGVSHFTMAQYEANSSVPSAKIYDKLLSVLDITPSGLLDQVPPPRTNEDRIREMISLLEELKEGL
jgi:DNA-binding XRE family transcriptional regulator